MPQRIVPMIAYEDTAAAIEWLTRAFGFIEREGRRYVMEDGTIGHAELELDGSIVMLATSETRPLALLILDMTTAGQREAATVVTVIITALTTGVALLARALGLNLGVRT